MTIDREISKLSQDLAQGLSGLRFMLDAYATRLAKIERDDVSKQLAKVETLVEILHSRIADLPERLRVIEAQVADLRSAGREHTGEIINLKVNEARDLAGVEKDKTKAETEKSKWGLYAAISTGILAGLASLGVQLMKWLGGTQ